MRQGILMWLTGMIGVLCVLLILPALLAHQAQVLPLWVVSIIQLVQSGAVLALAVWAGIKLSKAVNLRAPCFEAIASKSNILDSLRPQIKPAVIAGVFVALCLVALQYFTPTELKAKALSLNPVFQLLAEVFYGGITEELLLRFGVMTFITWGLWRIFRPAQSLVWVAIIVSSLLFAVGHLPAANALAGGLTPEVVIYVVAGNSIAGIVFGYLYKQYGLESAMMAHMLAHMTKYFLM